MKTRMELWREYRNSIERNVSLQKAVMESNEKLNILHSRLLKVYPEYDQKYPSNLTKFEASINKIEQAPTIPSENLEAIIDGINEIENDNDSSFASIENLSFESDELINTIKSLKEGKIKKIEYISIPTSELTLSKPKQIKLGEKMIEHRIAIDGPSGSGKSTVAKALAEKYGLKYINTGLVYRAIALKMKQNNVDVDEKSEVLELLPKINIKLLRNEIVELDGVEVTTSLRSDEVSQNASIVSAYPEVRKYAVAIQKKEGSRKGVIMDGRDTTFKIMPDADFKFFLDTSPEVRAKRRQLQNKELGYSTDYDQILEEIKIRDHRDKNRETDPLHITEGAHLIDATNMTIDDVVNKIVSIIEK